MRFAAMILAGLACGAALAADGAPKLDFNSLVERQAAVSKTLVEVAARMEARTPAEQKVRAVVYGLATTETVEAIKALEAIRREKNPLAAAERVQALAKLQDRTIEIIQRILGIMDHLKAQTKAEEKKEEGSDLDQANDNLNKLKDDMAKFAEEQRKVLDATAGLAKQNVEDFSPQEEEKLKQLEATQDKWENFLQDKYSDLSKMQVQDFSNPAMLNELVEIFSEVKMAKDALAKKAVEIATPAEEAGLEGATSIQTNLEKWLPDTPDRERWQMEEPLQDYQTPMAELPKELEDLVGDLMEEEEDLMNDIEDATSAWNDSIDKGVGWDAMDGPISCMSAKGVTGNRLPNSSEISGRSGEGRTGKAAGEFVENTATGKGGRRTPTRLTPDPFEKGVVDDKSQDSGGGSTGGGKISGAGGQGLEGPTPPPLKQQLDALAGKQAELRNRAERVVAGFKVMNYPAEDVQRVMKAMQSVEGELRSGRYTNIAREKKVLLQSMKGALSVAKGEALVQRDLSRVGAKLEDDIIEGPGEQTPRGYEELVNAYYQALSKTK
ncbi:MAG TPA: hypothetical protein P5137_08615 [Candidatus Brocadiia bacterium]|nr:hypothetical protein [Candidatus Brocadiia bacterium]